MYLLALLIPTYAVWKCGKKGQAILNFILLFIFIFPAIIHALFVVSEYKAKERQEALIQGITSANNQGNNN